MKTTQRPIIQMFYYPTIILYFLILYYILILFLNIFLYYVAFMLLKKELR